MWNDTSYQGSRIISGCRILSKLRDRV